MSPCRTRRTLSSRSSPNNLSRDGRRSLRRGTRPSLSKATHSRRRRGIRNKASHSRVIRNSNSPTPNNPIHSRAIHRIRSRATHRNNRPALDHRRGIRRPPFLPKKECRFGDGC